MESLFKAIYTKYAADAPLVAALTGGMRLAKVADKTTPPYAVYDMVSNVPEWTFDGTTIERARIQFSIVAADLETLNDCAKKLMACFDMGVLDFPDDDYATVGLIREGCNQIVTEDFYVYTIDYRMMICTI